MKICLRLCLDTEIWNLICLPMAPSSCGFFPCASWAQTSHGTWRQPFDPTSSSNCRPASCNCTQYIESHYFKTPYHTSILSGQGWVQELLDRHPEHICNGLGVDWYVFFGSHQVSARCRPFQLTPGSQAGGAAHNILVHLCHWSVSPSCWRALSEVRRHHIKVFFYWYFMLWALTLFG